MISLTVPEMPPHTHTPQAEGQAGQPPNMIWGSDGLGGGGGSSTTGKVYPSGNGLQSGTGSAEVPVNTTLKNTGGDTSVTPIVVKPHDNMMPYKAGTIIKRTVRAYYTVP